MSSVNLQALDKIEILTLQDNYIEMTAMGNPIRGLGTRKSVLYLDTFLRISASIQCKEYRDERGNAL